MLAGFSSHDCADTTIGMSRASGSGCELFGIKGLQTIHPAGSYSPSFPRAILINVVKVCLFNAVPLEIMLICITGLRTLTRQAEGINDDVSTEASAIHNIIMIYSCLFFRSFGYSSRADGLFGIFSSGYLIRVVRFVKVERFAHL